MIFNYLDASLKEITSHGRPFFLFSLNEVSSQIELLKKTFPNVPLHFSIKTNPNKHIVNHINSLIEGFDLSTYNELNYLLKLGIDPKKMMLSGPGKTDECLRLALDNNIKAIHVDSIDELEVLSEFIKIKKTSTKITLRIQTEDVFSHKLGLSAEEIIAVLSREWKFQFSGLHCYLGRESFNFDKLKRLIAKMEEVIDSARTKFTSVPTLFIGPGISRETPILNTPFHWKGKYPIEFEIGRNLVTSCGLYGAPVLAVKPLDSGSQFVLINGGLQHLGSPFIQSHKNLEKLVVTAFVDGLKYEDTQKNWISARLAGSLCLWHDVLHPQIEVPKTLKRGDFLLFSNCGAYGLTAGIPQFIGQDLPLEFVLDQNLKLSSAKNLEDISYHQGFEL